MKNYRNKISSLYSEIPYKSNTDGFDSKILRTKILAAIDQIWLERQTRELPGCRHEVPEEERIRIQYLRKAMQSGEKIAADLLFNKYEFYPDYLLQALKIGCSIIGQNIAMEYAAEVYPEKLMVKNIGMVAAPEQESMTKDCCYGFNVKRIDDSIELDEVIEMSKESKNDIFFDEANEFFYETLVFDDLENAKIAHSIWQEFAYQIIDKLPVKYAFEVFTTPDGTLSVGELQHAAPSEKNEKHQTLSGAMIEIMVFDSIFEADKQRNEIRERENLSKPKIVEKVLVRPLEISPMPANQEKTAKRPNIQK